ncbi:peptidase P60 [Photorhabdus laumondii subsp. laumondii]|uniref:Peptidase P60 n=1 Tax=Photorhabdus laumondii subsp. laumondii TaxID=141679 RepID=A0A6L9JL94_PHOLM|nr:C40 family peptidase [Photorhabdus laumondii]MCC8385156.1 C40 family peptidase [Photorhabdus laumondii]MCC8413907.1 C40 family peptidase [Photorhabdus laumondii]NDK92727.1 peptidase P60 [Photorhabdus laumondii subsp. laumondii]NDL19937.1 peptidase P60 [Photorhabdus laumondii subsp. laumondii]NDL30863.1 peptidase P60 [Photorhabdus laumondii subsp. laumondii]
MFPRIIQSIMEHAESEYPNECCGVIAQKSRVEKYFPCRNLAIEPSEQFHLDPVDYVNAEDWGTITAIVHSHPDATTQPSELDKAQCDATELPWIIVSWPEGDIRTIQPRGELPLIGRPFVLGHTDCWGLIMSYFRQEHGIELNDYRVDYHWWESGKENRYLDNWFECGFREFSDAPKVGDMVIMQVSSPVANHAGIILSDNMLLHHMYGQLSQRVPYGGYWKERTIKILRYRDFY